MNIKFQPAITSGDWMKIAILLAIAIIAWWQVFSLYTQPFDLGEEIKRQRLIQAHQEQTEPPLLKATR